MIGPRTTLMFQRVTETSDSLGGVTETWADLISITGVLTSSGGTLARWAGKETLITDMPTVTANLIFYCDVPVGVTLTEKDQCVLGSRKFNILYIYNPGNMNHHYEISLFEVK